MIKKIIITVYILSLKSLIVFLLDRLKLLTNKYLLETRTGIKFIARARTPDIAEFIITASGYEYPFNYIPMKTNLVIVDVGGHIGSVSLTIWDLLKDYCPRIICIEPENNNYQLLIKNIELNCANIEPYQLAISNKNSTEILDVSGATDSYNLIKLKNKFNTHVQKIKTSTLHNFCYKFKIQDIDVLFVDVEGSEYDIFNSSIKFIKEHVKILFIEMHTISEDKNPNLIIQILVDGNFKIVYLKRNVLCAINKQI